MTIRDYLGILRQRLLLALAVVALTSSTAVVLAIRQAPEYKAHARLEVALLDQGAGATHVLNDTYKFQKDIQTEAEHLKSESVATRVIARLHLKIEAQDLLKKVLIAPVPQSSVLFIEVTAPDAKLATALANGFPEEYIQDRREASIKDAASKIAQASERLTRQVAILGQYESLLHSTDPSSPSYPVIEAQRDHVRSLISDLETKRQDLSDQIGLKDSGVGEIIEHSRVADAESTSNPLRTGVLGFIIGLPLALGLSLLLDSMTDTIRNKEEIEKALGMETLGMIPFVARREQGYVVSREEPYSAAAEAFRTLRVNIESATSPAKRKLVFTSPGMGEGKTSTTANLGVAFAEAGRSALLVSADLRKPRLHHYFSVDPMPGFADTLKGEADSLDVTKEVSQNLYVLPSGTPDPRPDQLLHRVDLPRALDLLSVRRSPSSRPRNDENGSGAKPESDGEEARVSKVVGVQPQTMLIDAPPVLGAAEVSTLAAAADGVVLVMQMGVTRKQAVLRAAEQIRRTGGKVIGLVFVGTKAEKDYTQYEPEIDVKDGDSTWSKVVDTLQK
ncbi:MAG: Wzz/FepE/Etk N-terminal domain-containing protein [Actinomycetota bacterium]|nr:hypothetical protein [Actinomycetota bacterium]